jgi:ABC transporter substrate binding protein
MRRREFISLIGGVAATWPLAVQAQQPILPVVGLLRSTEPAESFVAAFRRGLSDSGYTDGTNVRLDIRVAEGKRDRLSELAADLVRKRVAAIVANTNAAPFAISATKSIPIVFVTGGLAVTFNIARALLTLLEATTPTFGLALVSVQTDISRSSPRRLGTRGIQRSAYRNPVHQAQCRQATSLTCTVRKMDDR